MPSNPATTPAPKLSRAALAIHILKVLNDLPRPVHLVRIRILVAMAGHSRPLTGNEVADAAGIPADSMIAYMKSAGRGGMIDEVSNHVGRAKTKYLLNDEGRAFVAELLTP